MLSPFPAPRFRFAYVRIDICHLSDMCLWYDTCTSQDVCKDILLRYGGYLFRKSSICVVCRWLCRKSATKSGQVACLNLQSFRVRDCWNDPAYLFLCLSSSFDLSLLRREATDNFCLRRIFLCWPSCNRCLESRQMRNCEYHGGLLVLAPLGFAGVVYLPMFFEL